MHGLLELSPCRRSCMQAQHWGPLLLVVHMNLEHEYYYPFTGGDKETFHYAWRALDVRQGEGRIGAGWMVRAVWNNEANPGGLGCYSRGAHAMRGLQHAMRGLQHGSEGQARACRPQGSLGGAS